nr:hypothetical protein [Tanacetum cinerariifolium]
MGGDGSGGGEGVLKAKSSRVIGKSEEEDVPLVDGVLNGAFGTFGDMGLCFGDGLLKLRIEKMSWKCLRLKMNEKDDDLKMKIGSHFIKRKLCKDAKGGQKQKRKQLMRRRSVMEGGGGRSGMTTLFYTSVFTDFSFLDESERMHDSINNVILAIVEIGVPLHDLSKQVSQKHTVRIRLERDSVIRYGMDRMALDRPLRRQVTIWCGHVSLPPFLVPTSLSVARGACGPHVY